MSSSTAFSARCTTCLMAVVRGVSFLVLCLHLQLSQLDLLSALWLQSEVCHCWCFWCWVFIYICLSKAYHLPYGFSQRCVIVGVMSSSSAVSAWLTICLTAAVRGVSLLVLCLHLQLSQLGLPSVLWLQSEVCHCWCYVFIYSCLS